MTEENKENKKDKNQPTPLMQQYLGIKAQYPDAVLFFRLGDFYEMFGEDAVKVHSILEVILTKRQNEPMCGVPYHSVNNYIRKLIKAGYKVAICEQLEDPATVKGIVKRGVVRVITPGTLLEENLLDSKNNNFLMSVVTYNKNSAAVAVTDISTGELFTYRTNLFNLENEIIKYKPNEIIVSQKDFGNETLKKILNKFEILVSPIKDIYSDPSYCENFIEKTLGVQSLNHFNISDKPDIISAAGLVYVYIKENRPQTLAVLKNIKFIENNNYMVLDSAAIKNLEILRSNSTLKSDGSLLSAIDSTVTPMGARLVRHWLVKPLIKVSDIKSRHKNIEFFVKNSSLKDELRQRLKSIYDLDRISSRIVSGSAHPKEMLALKDSLKNITEILNMPDWNGAVSQDWKTGGDFQSKNNEEIIFDIINKIGTYINPDAPVFIKDGGVIKQGISKELDEYRAINRDAKKYISDMENEEKQKTGISNLKIGYTSVFGYYIEVTRANSHLVPANYVRKQTLTNCERYITQELKNFEEKIISARDKIIKLETEIYISLRQSIAEYVQNILELSLKIAELDIYLAFADNALRYNYCCPEITDTKELVLKDARHPVVERILKAGNFVANDINLNDTDNRVMIITGPNMSGKSTYLRQTALIVIMAQTGSFVPCSSAKIGVVDRIFTRIGAGDNLAAGESTFMVEMSETANILNLYTDRSLIILDEVGRGTSTYDGMSIAWAVIEAFCDMSQKKNRGVKVLFATHYFELTNLADKNKGLFNKSVEVKEWNNNVIFLHKIIDGAADKSYGIHVAKIAGLPGSVIKRAKEVLKILEKNLNKNSSKVEEEINQPFLFTSIEPEILIELNKLDINNLKPLDALNLLAEWKQKYKN